ncbi:ABC transporter permease [Marispirochaeta aestuarii]|uniref:ABC transporter permease n=1 Tax=Marispirochaeta aestuarii TaxID=1963862 RepID=UPI0029C9178D|nr:ABC transporter permease [Marispirochaeta aestuarii]
MGSIFTEALRLIVSGDREVFFIAFTSLRLALASTFFASLMSIPLGIALHFGRFPFKRPMISVLSALMAVPTVVIGLLVFSVISRSGPLGELNLLFTPGAIIIGQVFLVLPVLTSLVYSGLSRMDPRFHETLITLGARRGDVLKASIIEARFIIISAVLAGFGRVVGEVGVSMMLGGNIRWYTRTMTTSIALETSKGQFELGISLGMILLAIALGINIITHSLVKNDV